MKRVLCSHWLHEYGRKAYTSCTPRGNKEKKKKLLRVRLLWPTVVFGIVKLSFIVELRVTEREEIRQSYLFFN